MLRSFALLFVLAVQRPCHSFIDEQDWDAFVDGISDIESWVHQIALALSSVLFEWELVLGTCQYLHQCRFDHGSQSSVLGRYYRTQVRELFEALTIAA